VQAVVVVGGTGAGGGTGEVGGGGTGDVGGFLGGDGGVGLLLRQPQTSFPQKHTPPSLFLQSVAPE
jgi:hypothetical protein